MKRIIFCILLGLAIAFGIRLMLGPVQAQGPIVGPGNLVVCPGVPGSPVPVQGTFTGTAALLQIVAGVAGKSIYICGWHITNTTSAGTFAFSYGTGTNCGTGTTTLVPALNVSNTAPSTDHIEYAFVQLPVGQALCQNSTATVSGLVYINQF